MESPIPLHCLAVDVETAEPVVFTGMRSVEELWDVLLATSRMPWVGGDPVVIGGRRYLDGGLAAPIPVDTALAVGATHVLVLQTRPHGVPRTTGVPLVDRVIERHLTRLNPGLTALYRDRVAAMTAWCRRSGAARRRPATRRRTSSACARRPARPWSPGSSAARRCSPARQPTRSASSTRRSTA